jgi:peptidoglycan/xylan/chitin deacetylase (PgdA/CDA1 family)
MQIIVAIENTKFYNAIKYTFQLLLGPFQLNIKYVETANISESINVPILITYGKSSPTVENKFHIHIAETELFGDFLFSKTSIPSPPFEKLNNIPVLYSTKNMSPLKKETNQIKSCLDIIASSFFLTSCLEEHIKSERDENGRFSAKSTLLFQQNLLQVPLVDEYSKLLAQWIGSFGIALNRKHMNSTSDFTICLSHDIDTVSKGWLEAFYYEIRNFSNQSQITKLFYNFIKAFIPNYKDLYWNFEQIMDLEKKYGAFSTFFFLKKTGDKRDAAYSIASKKMKKVFKKIIENDCEIGLHGSYYSLSQDSLLEFEKKALEAAAEYDIKGVRQHFLRFNAKNGWQLQEKAGLEYDTSLGFPDATGFRAGTSRPFRPFNFDKMAPHNIVEIPIIIMDGTLHQYLQLPIDQVWDQIRVVLEQVKLHNGAASVIWHNTYFTDYKFKGYKEIYEQIIKWVKHNNGELVTCKELALKWKSHILS